jgi:hypothetical protein
VGNFFGHAEARHKLPNVFRKPHLEPESLAPDGMFETQTGRVQRRPPKYGFWPASTTVNDVSHYGQSRGGQMNPNLMCAPGFRPDFELADSSFAISP